MRQAVGADARRRDQKPRIFVGTNMDLSLPVATVVVTSALLTLDFLLRLARPAGVIHVGAGNGDSARERWRGRLTGGLVLLDANPTAAGLLTNLAADYSGWQGARVLLGDRDVEATHFYLCSDPAAGGPLPVGRWCAIWPNPRALETLTLPQRRLDVLIPVGFRQIAVIGGLHPALGDAVYLPDWQSRIQAAETEKDVLLRHPDL